MSMIAYMERDTSSNSHESQWKMYANRNATINLDNSNNVNGNKILNECPSSPFRESNKTISWCLYG